jgi:Protein of unknown function (DUF2889)
MPLSAPQNRQLASTRETLFRCFRRDDGLWDIEGELRDYKQEPFTVRGSRTWQAGEFIHHMLIRVTIDQSMCVHAIEAVMEARPHGICNEALAAMQRMVGCTMGRGWRKAIDHHLGKVEGCTHMRELLFNMATAAFQGLENVRQARASDEPPPYLGTCKTWAVSSPVVEQVFPLFYRPAGHR